MKYFPQRKEEDAQSTVDALEAAPNTNQAAPSVHDENTTGNSYCAAWHGWCSFPQFPWRIWTTVFVTALVALIFADAATDVCGMVQASVYFTDTNTTEHRHIGINQYEYADGECLESL